MELVSTRTRARLAATLAVAAVIGGAASVATGDPAGAGTPKPAKVVQASVAGTSYDYGCATKSDHTVWCRHGNPSSPTQWTGFAQAASVSVGGSGGQTYLCALNLDQTVSCAGDNSFGQLGVNNVAVSGTPITVPGINDAVEVKAGLSTTCAVRSSGAVSCWGFGPLTGNGLPISTVMPPGDVPGISTATHVAMSASDVCVLLANGSLECWGDNHSGQLGPNALFGGDYTPQAIPNLLGVQQVSVVGSWLCALHSSTVSCWGDNYYGQLGQVVNDQSSQANPLPIALPAVKQIALGVTGGCALTKKGDVYCWGSSFWATPATPWKVSGLPKLQSLLTSVGYNGTCALTKARKVLCWGAPGNQLVSATPTDQGF